MIELKTLLGMNSPGQERRRKRDGKGIRRKRENRRFELCVQEHDRYILEQRQNETVCCRTNLFFHKNGATGG